MMKKWIALLLAMTTLLPIAVSCGKGGEEPADTTTAATTVATEATVTTEASVETDKYEIGDELPADLDYKGEELHFYSRGRSWCKDVVDVADMTGEVINDAVYNRNAAVEDRLNFKIVDHKDSGTDDYEIVNTLKTHVLAGASDYDVACSATYAMLSGITQNLVQNMLDLEHMDLSRPYWSQGINSAVYVGDAQYLATGAISLAYYRFIFATFFNKNLFEQHDVPFLYETVESGKWTLDYQHEIATGFYADMNGNNTADEADRFGFVINHDRIGVDTYWSSLELPILAKDENNFFVFAANKERMAVAVEKINSLVWDETASWRVTNHGLDEEQNDLIKFFVEDRAAMVTLRLIEVEGEEIRNMESKYGIVPVPKLDESQEQYHSHIHDNADGFCIPLTTVGDKLEMVGAVMEAMASEGYRTLMPAYYETALKTKYVSDEDSVKMLDLVIENLHVDSGFHYVDGTGGFHQNMRTAWISKNNSNISSALKAIDRVIAKQLDKLNSSIEKIQ
jgi:hypothetical protein